MTRTFTDSLAVREQVPLLIGLVGPSGGGKTFSALRLATGIQSVTGGNIFFIDTESNRAKHYADKFKFQHVPFGAPFSPLDYLAAIEYCKSKGAKTIIIDSMSHEHEGPGGVLEMHESELQRIGKGDAGNFLAWAKPKAERRRLINSILQMNVNIICCFRAKEKIKLKSGEKPTAQGWQPIAGEEFVFEMTLNCLLMPNANGVPSWNPEEKAERQMIKLPNQFRDIFKGDKTVLDESVGKQLAEWAKGGAKTPTPASAPAPAAPPPAPGPGKPAEITHASDSDGKTKNELASELVNADTMDKLGVVWKKVYGIRGLLTAKEFDELLKLKDEAKAELLKTKAATEAL